jgi:hypothetical protein
MIDQVEMRLVNYHVDEFFSECESIFHWPGDEPSIHKGERGETPILNRS